MNVNLNCALEYKKNLELESETLTMTSWLVSRPSSSVLVSCLQETQREDVRTEKTGNREASWTTYLLAAAALSL